MPSIKELRNEKAAKSEELAEIFDSVEEMSELSSDQKEEIKRRNQELADLGDSITELQQLEEIKESNEKVDEKVAKIHLDKIGAKLTKLSKEQGEYINVPVEGPYKSEEYRY